MDMVVYAVKFNSETRMTHVCITQGLCTHLLGCLFEFSDAAVHMLTAVANVDRESQVEVFWSGISMLRIILSMCNTQDRTCSSEQCALYAMCMRVCALLLAQQVYACT